MNTNHLLATLAALKDEYSVISQSIGMTGAVSRLNKLTDQILDIERQLAEVAGSEHAVPWDLPAKWIFSKFPSPVLVSCGVRTVLMYSTLPPTDNHQRFTAILSFSGCVGCKLGSPNDESIRGHPLFGKGIDVGGAYMVINSRWLAELEAINAVHSQFSRAQWQEKKHYLILFKDNTFECVADMVASEVVGLPVPEALKEYVFI